jgi:hypothetical protein
MKQEKVEKIYRCWGIFPILSWLCGTLLLIMLTGALVWFFIVGWRYCAL